MRQVINSLTNRRGEAGHPGLLLQRCLAEQANPNERRALLDAVLAASRNDSLCTIYSDAFERWIHALPTGTAYQARMLATTGRLVVGLGSENVLEAGLRLHHTYGVPLIPGSALKGLAAHYCHDVWGQQHGESVAKENLLFRRGGAHHSLLFGSTDDGGVITFHDAWVTPASLRDGSLRLDVMTPHHPRWQTNDAAPTDFDSPVPVSFLSADGTFVVRLSWSGPAATPPEQAESWTMLATTLLLEALAEWGVGGKTSSGYGRLVPPDDLRRQASAATQAKSVALPQPGELVEADLIEERTRKGGWKALHKPSGLSGAVQNTGDVPADKNVGDTLTLIVAIANDREIAFRHPTPADEARAQRAPTKRRGGRGGPGQGGRRS